MIMIELHRGDVVLVAFPFIAQRQVQWKRRPALVVQADRYNRRRAAVIIAAITSARAHQHLLCKLPGGAAGRSSRRALPTTEPADLGRRPGVEPVLLEEPPDFVLPVLP